MSTEDNKALIHRAYEGFNQRNLAVFNELCAPDLVFHNASTTIKGVITHVGRSSYPCSAPGS